MNQSYARVNPHAVRILLDSRKSTGENVCDSFTFIHNVSYSLYEDLFGFLENILEKNLHKNGFSYSC